MCSSIYFDCNLQFWLAKYEQLLGIFHVEYFKQLENKQFFFSFKNKLFAFHWNWLFHFQCALWLTHIFFGSCFTFLSTFVNIYEFRLFISFLIPKRVEILNKIIAPLELTLFWNIAALSYQVFFLRFPIQPEYWIEISMEFDIRACNTLL